MPAQSIPTPYEIACREMAEIWSLETLIQRIDFESKGDRDLILFTAPQRADLILKIHKLQLGQIGHWRKANQWLRAKAEDELEKYSDTLTDDGTRRVPKYFALVTI